MRRHMLLQVNRPLEGLVAVLALELLGSMHVLLVLVHPLLAVKHLLADVALVAVVLPFVTQQVLVESVAILHLL